MPANTNRDDLPRQCAADFRWLWLIGIFAVTATAIAFGRFRSNERVARAIAAGAARRRSEPEWMASE